MDSTTEVPEAKRRKIDEGTDNNVTSTPEINPAALPPMDKHDQAVKLSVRGSAAAAAKPDDTPFANLKLASWEPLKSMQRVDCPSCKRKRKYFCYDCFLVMGPDDYVPRMELPIHVDVVHFPKELNSKSSAIHAKILAPNTVSLFEYPDLPEFSKEDTVVLFPSKDAIPIEELDFDKVKRVVFVDCQWHKTTRMLSHPNMQGLKHVKISSHRTYFWRYQNEGPECLATIEAIYYFIREYQLKKTGKYEGEYDNLLYYYAFFYSIIQNTYKQEKRVFPRIENYVQIE